MDLSLPRQRAVFRVLLAVFVAWSLFFIYRTSFKFEGTRIFCLWDDAMVSMRFAKNLAHGDGFIWNPGAEKVQGYSNLGITLVMAGIHLLPIGLHQTSLVFQLMNLGLLVYGVFLIRDIGTHLFGDALVGHVSALIFMLCGPIVILSLQGTDVGVIAVVLLAALRIVVIEAKDGVGFPSRIYPILALGVLTRLDFAVVYVVFAGCSFLFFRRDLKSMIPAALVFGVVVGAILGFQRAYYGDWMPNTYYLKGTGSPLNLVLTSGIVYQQDFFTRGLVMVVVAALALYALQRDDRRIWLAALLPLALLAYDIRYGGDWVYRYTSRFFAPALPVLILLFVGAGYRVFERLGVIDPASPDAAEGAKPAPLGPKLRTYGFLLFSLPTLLVVNTLPALKEWIYPNEEILLSTANILNYRFARYLDRHTTKDTSVAVHMAGTLPYFLDRYTHDVLGKCDKRIAKMTVPRFIAGHSKWDWPYLIHTCRPDIMDHVSRGLVNREDFLGLYSQVEGTGQEPFLIRNDSLAKLNDPSMKLATPKTPAILHVDPRLTPEQK